MKKIFFGLVVLILVVWASPVAAHILKTDRNIGVLLHVIPDDSPIVGQPASFHIEIKDKDNRFDPKNCACTISLSQNDQVLYSQELFIDNSSNNINASLFNYTFPQKGVYTVVVAGNPKQADQFQQFRTKFDLRISRDANSASNSNLWLLIGGMVAVVIIGTFVIYSNKKK